MRSDVHPDSAGDRGCGGPTKAECDLFGHPYRIALLGLLDVDSTVSVDCLAERLIEREADHAASVVDHDYRQAVTISLVHNHLPRLADHGVVEWNRDAGTVSVPPEGLPAVDASLLEAWTALDADAFRTLAHPTRLAIREILAPGVALSLEELAERLAARAPDPAVDAERLAIDLRHSHLPAMAAADLLAYDDGTQTVSAPDRASITR